MIAVLNRSTACQSATRRGKFSPGQGTTTVPRPAVASSTSPARTGASNVTDADPANSPSSRSVRTAQFGPAEDPVHAERSVAVTSERGPPATTSGRRTPPSSARARPAARRRAARRPGRGPRPRRWSPPRLAAGALAGREAGRVGAPASRGIARPTDTVRAVSITGSAAGAANRTASATTPRIGLRRPPRSLRTVPRSSVHLRQCAGSGVAARSGPGTGRCPRSPGAPGHPG